MKKTVLKFGLISGIIASVLMLLTMPFIHRIGFEKGLIVGYTEIVLSFLVSAHTVTTSATALYRLAGPSRSAYSSP
jgi:hypothetical protein